MKDFLQKLGIPKNRSYINRITKTEKMNTYIVTMLNGSKPAMKVTVTAQNMNDARRQAESMHPGWRVNAVTIK